MAAVPVKGAAKMAALPVKAVCRGDRPNVCIVGTDPVTTICFIRTVISFTSKMLCVICLPGHDANSEVSMQYVMGTDPMGAGFDIIAAWDYCGTYCFGAS